MKNILYFCLFIIFSFSSFSQTDSVQVNIEVTISNLGIKNDSVFVAGSHPKFGRWSPGKIPLKKINDSTFAREFTFPSNIDLEFKFTRGSWSNEAALKDGSTPPNHILTVKNDTTVYYKIENWRDGSDRKVYGQITGTVNYIDSLKTREELLPRDVIIWLPPNYDKNIDKSYPVLYMHDGQNIIDPKTSSFGVDWQIDETADSLITNNIIEPIIIVGMYCTDNRYIEYSENDTGYAYLDFIANDLKPIIDKKYRTKPDRENTAIAGSSMGGLISFMAAWEYPDVFSKAACLSPALKIRSYNYVDNVVNYDGEKKDILLYIDNGGIALDDSIQTGVDEMLAALEKKGYKPNKDYFWFKDEDAVHNEAAWAERAWRFLTLFFNKDD